MVMFFGLTNSLATFQMMMNTIFCNLIADGNMMVYMDDMAIHMARRAKETESDHVACHRSIVHEVLQTLDDHNLYLNLEKCDFELPHIDFLGVRIIEGMVQMEQGKVDKVQLWKPPRNITKVWHFLGFTGYYQYFIQGYSQIARPLLDLTKKATPWHWNEEQQKAFEGLCDKMCEKPVLSQPDFTKMFYLQTDASAYGVGAVLSQEGDAANRKPKRHPVAYYSATSTPTEQRYDIYEREFLAVIKALENWRAYLIWTKTPFIIETDHKNLTFWKSPKKLNGRTARWHKQLQDYDFRIVHIAGKINTPADALSRLPGSEVTEDSCKVVLLPPEVFLNVFGVDSDGSLEHQIVLTQRTVSDVMEQWTEELPIVRDEQVDGPVWRHVPSGRLVIPPVDEIRKRII